MLPVSRKSVEPMAARVDPMHASARHQALHHFVTKAEWSDTQMLRQVALWVVPKMDFNQGGWWIIDDTGFPKRGRHSVGVVRQYCGMLGKQDNCQVAVSISLASNQGSLPVAWRLYLPEDWASDAERRVKAGVTDDVRFATKTRIALGQLRNLLDEGAPSHCVLADAGYGVDNAFRQALSDMGVAYAVDVTSAVVVWPPNEDEPSKYFLCALPEDISVNELVSVAHQRWRIERDYQDLKQDFGLGHYEGRGWRGFHHHAALSIAAYGFLMAERLVADKSVGGKKTSSNAMCLPFPRITSRAAVLRAQRHVATSIRSLRQRLSYQLIARLGRCPCCGRPSAKLLL